MTVSPGVIALVIGLIIILAIATVCFAFAWRNAELANAKLRSRYLHRFIELPRLEARRG